MSRLTRPPFILAYLADGAGCGTHRILNPLRILGRNGIITGRAESSFVSDPVLRAIRPDSVIFQRQNDESSLEIIRRHRAALPNAFFVYEIDDALSAVPDKSWHKPYMPPNVDAKTAACVALCDVVTVTTQDLADHMRSFCAPGTKFRVVPNMLGRDDFELATKVREQLPPSVPSTRLKIGWGGGIGHAGDLELLHEAMIILKDEVDWVFLGMDPEVPSGVTKYHAGTANPDRYLASLAAINVDLIVAPLEENLFNRCKSNLRLIEAGACGYPVIASSVAPYLTDNPPVWAYADTTAEWVSEIRRFITANEDTRKRAGAEMFAWANLNYNMDTHAEKRLLGWLPDNTRIFKPKLNVKGSGLTVVRTPVGQQQTLSLDLKNACESSSTDILYIRGDSIITDEAIANLRACDADIVIPISNDAGPWGFPNQNAFTAFDLGTINKFDSLCAKNFESSLLPLSAAGGPVMLIKRSALAVVGSPDFDHLSTEVALIDFSSAARSRGLKVGICPSAFAGVTSSFPPAPGEVETATLRITGRWPQGSNDDVAIKAAREKIELIFHKENYTALPPQSRNDYSAWAAQCDTRGSRASNAATKYLVEHEIPDRVQALNYPTNLSEHLPKLSQKEWLFFVPKGSIIPEDAIDMLDLAIAENPNAKLIYGDHDHLTLSGQRVAPDFKPNLDVHLLLCRDYITQAIAIRKDTLQNTALNITSIDESVLYRLALGIIHAAGRDAVVHIPRILAHLPSPLLTDAVKVSDSKLIAAQEFAKLENWDVAFEKSPNIPVIRSLHYSPAAFAQNFPLVSIIVPCKDSFEMLAPCIATIETMTNYPNYEIIVVSNNTTRPEMLAFLDELSTLHPKVTVVEHNHPFNWSALNNEAARKFAKGDFLCFLNDDTRVLSRNWLSELVGAVSTPGVGAAGARLVYPHGLIQHIGVVCHNAMTGHIHKGLPVTSPGTNFYATTSHESTAVTGACMVVKREIFEKLNGFDESFGVNFNDVVFCLELRNKLGLVSIVANNAELQHFEGVTRNPKDSQEAAFNQLRIDGARLGASYNFPDPYWNPNLVVSVIHDGCAIAGMDMATFEFPAPALPWKTEASDRILVIGDLAAASEESKNNAILFKATIENNALRITHPPMANCGPWDIRTEALVSALHTLDITGIVLGDLGEMPRQTLSLIRKLDLQVIYRPTTAESVCPRQTLSTPSGSCHAGYARGGCQSCLDEFSSPQGDPSHIGWMADWMRFFTETADIEVDFSRLAEPEYRKALEFVYYPESVAHGESETA